ncbi:MAG: RNA polymerase sigma factor [Cyclobacteriaceae bacterium]
MSEKEFGSAIYSHEKPLKGFAMKLTQDYDEASDLLQETFFKAYKNRTKFKEGTNLSAWLYTIMKNAFITRYQKMARQNTFVDTTEDAHHLNSGGTPVQNQAVSNLTMQELESMLNRLDRRFREPFIMYFRGFKYHEIAQRLDLPLGTIKNRIHVARQELQYKISLTTRRTARIHAN